MFILIRGNQALHSISGNTSYNTAKIDISVHSSMCPGIQIYCFPGILALWIYRKCSKITSFSKKKVQIQIYSEIKLNDSVIFYHGPFCVPLSTAKHSWTWVSFFPFGTMYWVILANPQLQIKVSGWSRPQKPSWPIYRITAFRLTATFGS